jgi:uncharacterized membrane protein
MKKKKKKKKKRIENETDVGAKANARTSKHEHIEHASGQQQHKLKREPLHKARRRLHRHAPHRRCRRVFATIRVRVARWQCVDVINVVGIVVNCGSVGVWSDGGVGFFQRDGGVFVVMATTTTTAIIIIIIIVIVVVVTVAIVIIAFQHHTTHCSRLSRVQFKKKKKKKKKRKKKKKKRKMDAAYLYGHVLTKAVQVTAPIALIPAAYTHARHNEDFDASVFAKYIVPVALIAGTGAFVRKGALSFDNAGFAERAARIGINTMCTEKNLWSLLGVSVYLTHSVLARKADVADDVGAICLRAAYNGTAVGMALFFVASYIRKLAEE